MRTFLKYILFIIVLTQPISDAWGQQVINFFLYRKEQVEGGGMVEKKAEAGIFLYSFRLKGSAEKALKKLKDHQTDELEKQDDFLDSVTTDNDGMAGLKVPVGGWIIISDMDNGNNTIREFTATDAMKELVRIMLTVSTESSIKLKEVRTVANRGGRKKKITGTASSCGGVLVFDPYPVIIDSLYARNNARFVLSPVVISRQNPLDTIGFLPPRILDGIDYDPSQVRYMGFDKHNDRYWKNVSVMGDEPSANYFNIGMSSRKEDTIYFQCKIRPYDDKKPWKIIGHYWYEDYKTVYYENNMLLYAGYSKNPTQFLEWRSSIPQEELDESHYLKRALTTPVKSAEELKLMFENGKPTLNFADSVTNASIDYMRRRIEGYYNNENAIISDISIHGFASPEGRQAGNEVLAMRRAQTIKDLFSSYFPNRSRAPLSSPTYSIVPWTEVADTIDALNDAQYAGIANEIRDICEQKKTLDAQFAAISTKGWYASLKDNILPRMRRVRITTEVVEQKVLSSEEINQLYNADKEGFLNESTPAYQYYQLMNLLYREKDWDELQRVAQKAYDSRDPLLREETTRTFMTNEIYRSAIDPTDTSRFVVKDTIKVIRPYPLAAYYLAKSKLEKNIVDTLTLKDYLDKNANAGEYVVKAGGKHWNEEAIAIIQILMYCLAEDYNKAYEVFQCHLPSNGKYQMFGYFIKYLSCNYTQEEKEEMRKAIETTSPANFVAVNLTEERDPEDGNKTGFQRAKEKLILKKKDFMRDGKLDASYYYLLAICRYQADCNDKDYEIYYYDSKNVYDPYNDLGKTSPYTLIDKEDHWAMPMLDAFRRDAKWVEHLKEDGFFNDAYRTMLLFFWQRIQDGVEMADIAKEYDTLAKKYFETKK